MTAMEINGSLEDSDLGLAWGASPWDSTLLNCPVLQIQRMEVRGLGAALSFSKFEGIRDELGCNFVSCRLNHDQLPESMLLEGAGFKFIEMLFQPEITCLFGGATPSPAQTLTVERATSLDMPVVSAIATTAFRNERFHMDFRLPAHIGDQRYLNWVKSAMTHATQRLYVLKDAGNIVSFFVTENLPDGTCYWHLNAVDPTVQGNGYGKRSWLAMMQLSRFEGMQRVRSAIVARNHRVLNLYARLGFSFPVPMMTFHWVRQEKCSPNRDAVS